MKLDFTKLNALYQRGYETEGNSQITEKKQPEEKAKLDFTKLNALYQRGYETEEQRRTHDELIEQGYTCIDAQDTPFTASEPARDVLSPTSTISPEELETASKPLSGAQGKPKQALILDLHSGTLNYSEFARDVFNYIQRNKIDSVDTEYWRTHPDTNEPPEAEREYLKRIRVEQMKLYSKYGRNYAEETDLLKFEELETIDTMVACAWALLENHYTMQRDRAKADPASVTASGQ